MVLTDEKRALLGDHEAAKLLEKLSCRKSIRVGSRCMRCRARNTTAELMGAHTRQRKMPWHTGTPAHRS